MSRPRTYDEARALVGTTEVASYSGGWRRYVHYEDGFNDVVVARLFATNIVTWHPDGRIVLDNGGHSTLTTYDAMAVALSVGRAFIGTRAYVPHYLATPFDAPDHRRLTIHPDNREVVTL